MITLQTNQDLINFIKSHKLTSKEVSNLFQQIGLSAFFINETSDYEAVAKAVQAWFEYEGEKPIFLDNN
jgi:hypothetical protein